MLYLLHQHNRITKKLYNSLINIIKGVHTGDNKHLITIEPKTFHFDLSKNFGDNLKHENDSIMKYNDFLADHRTKN